MTTKVFGFQRSDQGSVEPPTFKLQEGTPEEPAREYVCRPEIDGLVLLSTVAAMNEDDPTGSAGSILQFFEHVIGGDEGAEGQQYRDFRAEVTKLGLNMKDVTEVIAYLLGKYTDFPT